MLCTKCNAPIRPVVALDIDGTMGRWLQHFLSFAEQWFGQEFGKYHSRHYYDGTIRLSSWMRVSQEEYRSCKLAFRMSGLKRSMPTWGSPQDLTTKLAAFGVEVWVTTTRPYLRMDNMDPDTREWLQRNRVHYDGLIYDEDKYARLIEIVGKERIIAVVEDEAECYDRATELGLHPILASRETNRGTPRPVSAQDDGKLLDMIQARALRWKDLHVERG